MMIRPLLAALLALPLLGCLSEPFSVAASDPVDDAGAIEPTVDAAKVVPPAPPASSATKISPSLDAGLDGSPSPLPDSGAPPQNAAQLGCQATCNGCCELSGNCLPGNGASACGVAGAACVDCAEGLASGFDTYCNGQGVCVDTPAVTVPPLVYCGADLEVCPNCVTGSACCGTPSNAAACGCSTVPGVCG